MAQPGALGDIEVFNLVLPSCSFPRRKSRHLLNALVSEAWLGHKTDERSYAGRSSQIGTFKAVARDGTHEYDTCARVARNVLPGGEPDGRPNARGPQRSRRFHGGDGGELYPG